MHFSIIIHIFTNFTSPDLTLLVGIHAGTRRTFKCFGKCLRIRQWPDDPIQTRRMRASLNLLFHLCITVLGAPNLTPTDPEKLLRSEIQTWQSLLSHFIILYPLFCKYTRIFKINFCEPEILEYIETGSEMYSTDYLFHSLAHDRGRVLWSLFLSKNFVCLSGKKNEIS